jgi:predicted NBD/HSP70 family sugar kinase/3-dehydroquinate dehydratase
MSAAGLELGGTWLRGVVVHRDGEIGARLRERVPDDPARLAAVLTAIWERCGAATQVALASAPVLDRQGRVQRWPSSRAYEGADVLGPLRARGLAPLVLDDASAAARAEHLAVAADHGGPSSTVLVSVGTGTGGGAVLRDRLWLGARGQALDLGHVPVPAAAGLHCACGCVGCAQAALSGRRLERAARAAGLSVEMLDAYALADDARAARLLDELVAPLVETLRTVDRVFDPDRIVLGGGLGSGAYLAGRARTAAAAVGCAAPVLRARWGTWAGALGAAVELLCRTGERVRCLRPPAARWRVGVLQGPGCPPEAREPLQGPGADTLATWLAPLALELDCSIDVLRAPEAELVGFMRGRSGRLDGLVIEPEGLAMQGQALRDELLAARIPFVEVGSLSADARTPPTSRSCLTALACGSVGTGGAAGCELGLRALLRVLDP